MLPVPLGAGASAAEIMEFSLEGGLLEARMLYPKMLRIRQQFERPRVENVPLAVRAAVEQLDLRSTIRPGQTVALTAGSRGIANIPLVLRSVATFLRDL